MIELLERPEEKTMPEWVPVIFANGADDDLPGFVAMFENRKVQLGDKIYKPDEAMILHDLRLRLSRQLKVVLLEGTITFIAGRPWSEDRDVVVLHHRNGRNITITHCRVTVE